MRELQTEIQEPIGLRIDFDFGYEVALRNKSLSLQSRRKHKAWGREPQDQIAKTTKSP